MHLHDSSDHALPLQDLRPSRGPDRHPYRGSCGKVPGPASRDAGEPAKEIKKRVDEARRIQLNRFKGMKVYCNAQMTNRHIKKFCQIDDTSQRLLETAIDRFGLSARAYTRILKVAMSIADLDAKEDIHPAQYRSLDWNLIA